MRSTVRKALHNQTRIMYGPCNDFTVLLINYVLRKLKCSKRMSEFY